VLPGATSTSVTNSAGNIGRPDGSTPPWASVAPTCRLVVTHVGVAVGAGAIGKLPVTVVPAHVFT